MTYDEAISRWVLLGDALALPLPPKAVAEILLGRTAYGKAVAEFEAMRGEAFNGAADADGRDEVLKRLLAGECGAKAAALSTATFEEVVASALSQGKVATRLMPTPDGKPTEAPAMSWLEKFTLLTDSDGKGGGV